MSGLVPPGWPEGVPPPGAPDWQRRVVGWLYDLCPPDYRGYDVLRRYPVGLARLAGEQVAAAAVAARAGLASVRGELRTVVPAGALEELVAVYERELDRLARAERAVRAVRAALSGPPS